MSDNAERDKLQKEQKQVGKQRDACAERIQDYEYRIKQLKKAKESVSDLKKDFNSNQKLDKKLYKEKKEWEGSNHDQFKSNMEILVAQNEDYYKNGLDKVLDALNDEITRLENKLNDDRGLWGWLCSKFNSLGNEIEKMFN